MPEVESEKKTNIFECETCDFKCTKKSNWNKHVSTDKHKKLQNHTQSYIKNAEGYYCECGRKYGYSSNYYAHRKKCVFTKPITNDNTMVSLVLEVVKSNAELQKQHQEAIKQNQESQQQTQEAIKQNQELQKQMIDICKNGVNTTTNMQTINNNNSNNKSFNLNVFLNETCKDAMNMKDFVDSIQITLTDIENMGKLGFVNGISNIIVNRLKAIDVHLRPVHCTDQRRETMYVKEKNQWSKEEEDNKNIRRFIQLVAHKNTKNLNLFKNKHPDCLEYHSKYNDQYNKIVMETFGGYGNTDYDSENKIIRKLVKELTIDKSL